MHDDHDTLLALDEALGTGSGDAYRRHLDPDAVVIVPGAVLDRDACAAAMDDSAGWDEHEISDARSIAIAPDAALITYHWSSRRGDQRYEAVMSSVYRRHPEGWQLVLHQQTPAT